MEMAPRSNPYRSIPFGLLQTSTEGEALILMKASFEKVCPGTQNFGFFHYPQR
ncbi:hypothetical protein METBIDRAFT_33575 [Metschnikowia bicuspidata var. bicuspidata NRRL YB-4993]|uniref:Uncharacterized protein n=1 Tax=Metschnikowia bicuspidata var. bicuspidata NRRL YB-4993 TaxID=869754 RepID=A0A1A0H5V2_9ASCO|nr:hypothetical protein METBIDRAFT_33575 [Metschnikowia bicuspidata var. bicuspidata NRRL YB-4993]OBA19411.1 hypothetical protein METBIDRAFT_33575 [Metschnikowia bicuspidata var. bicuspidata NRRL YB-4993]